MTKMRWVDAAARALMAAIFLLSGWSKLVGAAAIQSYMQAHGVPGFLVWPAAAFEVGSGTLLLVGFWTRPVALGLAGWCLLTAALFHTAFADPNQMINFLKNLAMAGGFLVLASKGATGLSLDGRLASAGDPRS